MSNYLKILEETPIEKQWELIRSWIKEYSLDAYEELREDRPILELPELTLVTKFEDCTSVLRQHDIFSVALYKPKQGGYWMSQDDTAEHWRDKSVMRSILDLEELGDIREFVANKASSILTDAKESIEAVNELCRAIPIMLVQEYFGFDESDKQDLFEWSYWSQYDTFHNQPFDLTINSEEIINNRKKASEKMALYLAELVKRRIVDLENGKTKTDPVTRLVKLSMSGGIDFDINRVAMNVGGLLIGAVETTSHATINVIYELLKRPEVLAKAKSLSNSKDLSEFDGFIFEALRFRPAFPYFFRVCEKPTKLGVNTDYEVTIKAGTTVLALTHSAMFDSSIFLNPNEFDSTRSTTNMFHFGYGLHKCLGQHIGEVMIPEIVRQVIKLEGLHSIGNINYKGGTVPESYILKWENVTKPQPQCWS